MSITPQQAARRFSLAEKKFGQVAEKIARDFVNKVSIRATNLPHMRESINVSAGTADIGARSSIATQRRTDRRPSKAGPLRVVSGRLKRSILPGGTFLRSEAIERVTQTGFKLRFEKGSKVPYARIHEEGGTIKHPGTADGFGQGIFIGPYSIKIPKRAYIGPATLIEKRKLAKDAGREIKNMIVSTLRGQA